VIGFDWLDYQGRLLMAKSYFAILELTPNATEDDIRSAYRRLAKEYHPDHYAGGSGPFQQIQEAYAVLVDSARRAAYEKKQSGASRLLKNSLPGSFHIKIGTV
jgi:curved DNA-binding protein CbpA